MKEQPNFLYGKDSRFLASIEQKIVKEEAEIREKYQIPKEVTIYKDNENVWRVFSDSRKVTVERWYLENEALRQDIEDLYQKDNHDLYQQN